MSARHPDAPRLLIVDDNAENRDLLSRRLRRLGYERLLFAEDGQDALEVVTSQLDGDDPIDIILLDVMMPRKSGVEVLEILSGNARTASISVLMISADTDLTTVVRCIELGAEDYLAKPFNPILLRARLTTIVEKRRLRREVDRQLARLERELAEAREQQLGMLPAVFPTGTRDHPVSIHAIMHPAREVGGDLYDCFEVLPHLICVAVGDVSDKGMPAALYMARTRSLIRSSALQHAQDHGCAPMAAHLVRTVNAELCKNNDACMFVTLFVGFLDLATGDMDFVNAGHLRPWVFGAGGFPTEIESPIDLPVGVTPDAEHQGHKFSLRPGELLTVITDGLPEMTDPDGQFYGMPRIVADLAELAGASPEAVATTLAERVRAFAGTSPVADDVTVLALRRG